MSPAHAHSAAERLSLRSLRPKTQYYDSIRRYLMHFIRSIETIRVKYVSLEKAELHSVLNL